MSAYTFVLAAAVGAVAASSDVATRPAFVPALFVPQVTKNPEQQKRWAWPAESSFRSTWDEALAARAIRVVRGRVSFRASEEAREAADVFLAIQAEGDRWSLDPIQLSEDDEWKLRWIRGRKWTLEADTEPLQLVFREETDSTENRVVVDVAWVAPEMAPGGDLFSDWVYATSLMRREEPVYQDVSPAQRNMGVPNEPWKEVKAAMDAGDKRAALERLRTCVPPGYYDSRVLAAAKLAEEEGDFALARSIWSRYRPVGGCSVDNSPALVAIEYADFCYRRADLACFLQLQVQIMGQQFERAAYSSFGDVALGTHAERLAESGMDVDRFLLGMLARYGSASPRARELGEWRLSRAIRDAGRADALRPVLRKIAEDPAIDEVNRLRATRVLVHLMLPVPGVRIPSPKERAETDAAIAEAKAALAGYALPDSGRVWASQYLRGE